MTASPAAWASSTSASVANGLYAGSSTPDDGTGEPWIGEIAVKPSGRRRADEVAVDREPVEPGRRRVGGRLEVLRGDEQVARQRRLRLAHPVQHAPVEALDAGAPDQPVDAQRVDDLGDEASRLVSCGGVEGVVLDLEVEPHRVGAALLEQRRDLPEQRHRGRQVGAA